MTPAFEISLEEGLHDPPRHFDAQHATAERQDVRIVMRTRVPRGELRCCARRPDARHFVARHRRANADAVDHHSETAPSGTDLARYGIGELGIINRTRGVGAHIYHAPAEVLQATHELLLELEPAVIGAHSHRPRWGGRSGSRAF